jgi:glucosamine 6-phosphate synthetase-like amidotransferase/phosphosugar isomerase protein
MCGIFGAVKQESFLDLYDLNRKRGTFSTSLVIFTSTSDLVLHRWNGSISVKDAKKALDESIKDQKIQPYFYLGHTQAPTSSKRTFSKETAHPFVYENWVVAHNGVLTNFENIKKEFNPKWSNPVDSSIIPYMLHLVEASGEGEFDPPQVQTSVLSQLEGTFGLWIANTNTRKINLARCGSTLFANMIENEFSSVKFKGSETLDEGIIYEITVEGITSIAHFDFNSPFFT